MAEKSVTVYSSPTWTPCKQTKEFLSSKGISFTDVNVMEDVEGREELVRRTGQMTVPVIVVGDEVVLGFDRARLTALLGI
jgi:glutaredoxin 3